MKKALLIFTNLFLLVSFGISQQEVDKKYKKECVDNICTILNDFYVFPDVAKETSDHLQAQLKAGAFDDINDEKAFADALTKELQSINHDKHMRVRQNPPRKSEDNTSERVIENQLANLHRRREGIGGFSSFERLDGNVAYLDYRGFYGMYSAKDVIDSFMRLAQGSDAMIIDLRKNGGGSPETVQYLCSYFFEDHVHLNSLYWRETDETTEFWTLDEVGGEKLGDIPLFVITSSYTFSGAEEFSYNMQTQKRATLVGETTGGGANPGGGFSVSPSLTIFVPTGTAINPITKTNWEGVGVIPEVKTSADDAYDKTIELANLAAEEYRVNYDARISKMYAELITALDDANLQSDAELSSESESEILTICGNFINEGIMGEGEINILGYTYLTKNQIKPALALFKANCELFPNSPNTYDSYAEALANNGNLEQSKTYYEKAVKTAEAEGDPQIELYKENLEGIKKKISKN